MRLRGLFIILQVMMCFCLSAKIRTLSICIGEYPAESGWNDLGANNDADLIRDCFHDAKIILNEEATNKKILTELTFLTVSYTHLPRIALIIAPPILRSSPLRVVGIDVYKRQA